MNSEYPHESNEPSEDLLHFLAQMLDEFTRNGWGQPGSITEFGNKGEFKHRINEDFVDPIDFIDSYQVSDGAKCLMLHWEYWPPVEVLDEQPDAELFRTVLWADKTGNLVAVLAGSASPGWLVVPEAFDGELHHLARGLGFTSKLEAS